MDPVPKHHLDGLLERLRDLVVYNDPCNNLEIYLILKVYLTRLPLHIETPRSFLGGEIDLGSTGDVPVLKGQNPSCSRCSLILQRSKPLMETL